MFNERNNTDGLVKKGIQALFQQSVHQPNTQRSEKEKIFFGGEIKS